MGAVGARGVSFACSGAPRGWHRMRAVFMCRRPAPAAVTVVISRHRATSRLRGWSGGAVSLRGRLLEEPLVLTANCCLCADHDCARPTCGGSAVISLCAASAAARHRSALNSSLSAYAVPEG